MATRAFILVTTSVGKTKNVVAALQGFKEVTSVDRVTGPYDIIAVVEASDLNSVGDVVMSRVRTVPGILRTETCLVLSLP